MRPPAPPAPATSPAAPPRQPGGLLRATWVVPAAFVILGLIWGSSFLWIKIAVQEIPPATLVAWRMTLGAIAMLAFLPLIGQRLPRSLRELWPLAVLGLINSSLPVFLISWGEQYVDSGTAAVLNSLTPLFSLVIAGLWLRVEPVTGLRILGLVLGFGGAFVLASRELALRSEVSALVGALAVVAAAGSYAAGASYVKHRIGSTHRYVVAAGTLLFAAVYAWLLAAFSGEAAILPHQAGTLVAVAWLGLLGMFVAYLLYFFLIERVGATMASMVTYVFPVVGVALGVIFLAEPLDLRLVAGTALVVVGIGVVSLRYDRRVSQTSNRAAE